MIAAPRGGRLANLTNVTVLPFLKDYVSTSTSTIYLLIWKEEEWIFDYSVLSKLIIKIQFHDDCQLPQLFVVSFLWLSLRQEEEHNRH